MPAVLGMLNDHGSIGYYGPLDLLTGLPYPAFVTTNAAPAVVKLDNLGNGWYCPIKLNLGNLCSLYFQARELTVTTPEDNYTLDLRNLFSSGPTPFPSSNDFAISQSSLFYPLIYDAVNGSISQLIICYRGSFATGIPGNTNFGVYADGMGGYFPVLRFTGTGVTTFADPSTSVVGTLHLQDMAGNDIGTCNIYDDGLGSSYGDVTVQVTAEW